MAPQLDRHLLGAIAAQAEHVVAAVAGEDRLAIEEQRVPDRHWIDLCAHERAGLERHRGGVERDAHLVGAALRIDARVDRAHPRRDRAGNALDQDARRIAGTDRQPRRLWHRERRLVASDLLQREHHRRRVEHRAFVQATIDHEPRVRRSHRGALEILLGAMDARLCLRHPRALHRVTRHLGVELLLRHHLLVGQPARALHLLLRLLELGAGEREPGLRVLQGELIGLGIDAEDRRALAHGVADVDHDPDQAAAHLGAELGRARRQHRSRCGHRGLEQSSADRGGLDRFGGGRRRAWRRDFGCRRRSRGGLFAGAAAGGGEHGDDEQRNDRRASGVERGHLQDSSVEHLDAGLDQVGVGHVDRIGVE